MPFGDESTLSDTTSDVRRPIHDSSRRVYYSFVHSCSVGHVRGNLFLMKVVVGELSHCLDSLGKIRNSHNDRLSEPWLTQTHCETLSFAMLTNGFSPSSSPHLRLKALIIIARTPPSGATGSLKHLLLGSSLRSQANINHDTTYVKQVTSKSSHNSFCPGVERVLIYREFCSCDSVVALLWSKPLLFKQSKKSTCNRSVWRQLHTSRYCVFLCHAQTN